MPWEKSFDEQKAVENAMRVFWMKGFEATSIADLIQCTGINRGSLYNAFGGKKPLFARALKHYDNGRRILQSRLEALDDPKEIISSFFDATVNTTVEDPEKKGCFLFNTTLEMDIHGTEINTILTDAVSEIEGFLRRTIEAGQRQNQFPAHLDAAARSKSLVASTAAIRVLGRGVYSRSDLQSIADEAKRSLA